MATVLILRAPDELWFVPFSSATGEGAVALPVAPGEFERLGEWLTTARVGAVTSVLDVNDAPIASVHVSPRGVRVHATVNGEVKRAVVRNAHLAVMLMRLFDARRLKAQFLPCGSVVIDDRTFTPAELDGLADALVGPHAGFVTKEVRHAALSDAENARQVRVLARVARWYAAWERDAARVRGE